MMKNRFFKFIRVYWKGILLYAVIAGLITFMAVFLYYGGTSFWGMEGFYRKNMMAQMGMYMVVFIFIGIVQAFFSTYIYMYFMMGGGMSKMLGKDSAEKGQSDVKWDDVIGMENAKRDAWEIVQFIKDANKVKAIGGTMIKGVLMVGPPGCGKTYLAKAIASECKLPFLSAVGSEFVGMFMGIGAARIKSLFKRARQLAAVEGGCLIFIDEIDSFAGPRSQETGGGATTSSNATINQFLTELDGLRKRENGIVVIAATNVPPEKLDTAIMRSGRFDRKITIDKPTSKEREALIAYYLKKVAADPNIDIPAIADKSQWFSPADINNMVREASIQALRDKRSSVTQDDMLKGLSVVMVSIEKTGEDKVLSSKINVKWDEVIGMEETKKDAWEIVELLKDRHKLKVVGGQIIKGVMLIGPPGCGKTYLAKAMATESGFPFVVANGSEFIRQWMGTASEKVRSVFREARNLAKSEGGCIIFIDEIDAFATPRTSEPEGGGGAVQERGATVNQFLTELDGLKGENNNIVVLAATNVSEDKLDPAVMRSGRFDRKIYFQKPSSKDRQLLMKHYMSKIKCEDTIDIPGLAEKAKWFSPADINNMVREAGILALREKREIVNQKDMEGALDRVMHSVEVMGENKILGGKVNVKWDQVIGMKDAKEEAWEIVKLLKDRNLLKAIGGKIVKGVIMFGPPGCGKTYLAKAMATEAGFPFMSAVGSDLVGVYVGEGARKMKDIFKEARELAQAEGGCIIFFDEVDSFATPRGSGQWGGTISHNATINQFLTELDGLRQQENNIVVLAATNVREDQLDPAILRAGRIERKIYISLPNLQEREDIFKYYLAKVKYEDTVSASVLARTAVGFTPSDIDNMIREAGLIAMRNNRDMITPKDLSESYDRLTMGAVTNAKYSQKSLKKTAYHEAGHAILTYLVDPTDEVIKATVRPRKGALGYIYTRAIEELESNSPNHEHLLSKIKMMMAGYVGEKIALGTTGSGVGGGPGSDFYNAMNIASRMVWCLGMGPSGLVGDFDALKDNNGRHNISEKTKEVLDNDVQSILQMCLKETTEILSQHKDLLEYFAQELLNKGDLEYDEMKLIFQKFNLKPAAQIETS
ncbi:MAG: AAA family ATPase [Candidatus Omnitrophica bacterium]|nr:AAA family ATPase [Candidatus Omnitrophota bacterium]